MVTEPRQAPRRFTLGRAGGLQIEVMDIGATWLSCLVPMPGAAPREVLLGHADPARWADDGGFLGATIGRFANRIAGARFELGGHEHRLVANEGANQLHGGPDGFHRRRWSAREQGPLHLRLGLHSPAGDQGYPGALEAAVEYRLDPEALALTIAFEATVSQPCPVSLTNHAYFNLDGGGTVLGHRLRVAAAHWLPVDPAALPLGHLAPVAGTPFDLREPQVIGVRLGEGEPQHVATGYDHCLALDDSAARGDTPAAELISSDERLSMQLYATYPGLQVYSGYHLPEAGGRDGRPLPRYAGLALEPEFFPDSPNHPPWRDMGCILQPGQRYRRWMRLRFNPR